MENKDVDPKIRENTKKTLLEAGGLFSGMGIVIITEGLAYSHGEMGSFGMIFVGAGLSLILTAARIKKE